MSDDQTITGDHTSEPTTVVESYGSDSSKRLPIQVGIVAGVLLVSGGVLYWMHIKGIEPGKLLKPVEMRYTIEQTQARYYEGEDRILKTLAQVGPPPQIPLEDIHENPFRLDRAPEEAGPIIAAEPVQVRDQVLVEAEHILDSMRIEMVLNSETNPLAKINGKVYRVGDKVDGVLEIVSITGRSVTFRAKTLMRTLEMENKH